MQSVELAKEIGSNPIIYNDIYIYTQYIMIIYTIYYDIL